VLYLHFSKTSGAALCKLAKAVGCETWRHTEKNCAIRHRSYQDGPWWLPASRVIEVLQSKKQPTKWHLENFAYPDALASMNSTRRLGCTERLARAPRFHAIESTLPGGVLCAGFYSIALLRPPLERAFSHSMELARWGMVVPSRRGYCANYTHMRRLAPVVFDNYYTRVLLGAKVLGLPAGAITAAHRSQAERLLRQFDLVLTNNGEETPGVLLRATGIANFTSCRATRRSRCQMKEADTDAFARDNGHDMALYGTAVQLASRHAKHWRAGRGGKLAHM
jgi:hypothetical protein